MKGSVCLVLLIACLAALPVESAKSYRNHKVVTFKIENEDQLKELQSIELQSGVRVLQREKKNSEFLFNSSSSWIHRNKLI